MTVWHFYWLFYGAWVTWIEAWVRRSVWMAHPVLTWGLGLVAAFAWPLIAPVVLFVRTRDAYRARPVKMRWRWRRG